MNSEWDARRKYVLGAVEAVEQQDSEAWGRVEAEWMRLPRSLAPREREHLAADAAEHFTREFDAEPEESFATPFADINECLDGGFRRGQLVVIAADGKQGKSQLVDQFMATFKKHRPDLRCSLFINEMTPKSRRSRWVQRELGIPSARVKNGNLSQSERDRIVEAAAGFPFDITGIAGDGFQDVANQITRLRPDVACVDIVSKFPYSGERELALGVSVLDAAAKSVNALLILTSHLNEKGVNSETGIRRTPTPTDIRDSGAVKNFADVLMFLHRRERKDERGHATGDWLPSGRLYMPYVRDGESGGVKVKFNPDRLRFELPPQKTEEMT